MSDDGYNYLRDFAHAHKSELTWVGKLSAAFLAHDAKLREYVSREDAIRECIGACEKVYHTLPDGELSVGAKHCIEALTLLPISGERS